MSSRFSKLKNALDERREEESLDVAGGATTGPTPEPERGRARTKAVPAPRANTSTVPDPSLSSRPPKPPAASHAVPSEPPGEPLVQRNGVSMLPEEWRMIDDLRNAYYERTQKYVKMNVIVRAAVRALEQARPDDLVRAIERTPELKPGRKAPSARSGTS